MNTLEAEIKNSKNELQELRQEQRLTDRENKREIRSLTQKVSYLEQRIHKLLRGNDQRIYTRAIESVYERFERPTPFVLSRQALLLNVSHHLEIVMNAKQLAAKHNKRMADYLTCAVSVMEDECAQMESTFVKERCVKEMEKNRIKEQFRRKSLPQRMVIDRIKGMLEQDDGDNDLLDSSSRRRRRGSLENFGNLIRQSSRRLRHSFAAPSRRLGRRRSCEDTRKSVSSVRDRLRNSLVMFADDDEERKQQHPRDRLRRRYQYNDDASLSSKEDEMLVEEVEHKLKLVLDDMEVPDEIVSVNFTSTAA